MGTSFLGALADQISSQFSLGENTNHTLDDISTSEFGQSTFDKPVKYGQLGDFAQHFDQSSERRYVEEGYLRKDPYNTDPKQFEILMQEPNATVFIKKKMFSSVGNNFRPDFMDKDEKLYYRAMRILFQNKCKQIGALEKLSKLQKVTSAIGSVPDQLMPVLFTLTDSFTQGLDVGSNLFGALGSSNSPLAAEPSTFVKTMDRLRRIYAFNATNPTTTWITDSTNLFQAQFGQGTGVIEITNFTNLSTQISTNGIESPGHFSLTISDPYESMLITEYDIEKSISDATNMFYNAKTFQFAKTNSDSLINDLQHQLNTIRAARNASPISFKIDPDTLLGKRVTAILDRLGIELPFNYDSTSAAAIFSGGAFGSGTQVAPEYLRGGAVAGQDGLDPQKQHYGPVIDELRFIVGGKHKGIDSELSIFNRIVSTVFSKISLEANSKNAFQTHNKDTNYTRRKLRFNFLGKLIIQPMDVAHIYINSKSRWDNKLLSGLQNMFTGVGMLQNLNNTLTNLTNVAGVFNPSGNIPMEIEKSTFVGADFPNFLWPFVRGNFVSENEGTHVFAGLVQNVSDSWSNGAFNINVSGADNTAYFDQGKVNFSPAVDVFNGSYYDPLTPFKTNFDTISTNFKTDTPELLDENKFLLGTGDGSGSVKSIVKAKLGRYAGELVNESDVKYTLDRNFDPLSGRITKTFYAPDGLVYKWKEGIGVFTQFGSNIFMNDPSKVGAPNIAREPFAGQNVMNVLSLLITGVPYNFATYYNAAIRIDGSFNDPQSKENAAHSFLNSLRNDLVKNNTLWGNFVPFKNLSVDEGTYVKQLQKVSTVIQKNLVLDEQFAKLQDLNQAAYQAGAASAFAEISKYGNNNFPDVQQSITETLNQIETTLGEIKDKNDASIQTVGDDVSFDSSTWVDSGKSAKSLDATRRLLRRQLNFLTRRMSYNVRANEDKNLFVVDDFYDKDFDILAYEEALTDGIKLFNNEFNTVRDKIRQTASLLNLEVFCDTQGHIRVRPPQYNRMPSSVFYRMMYLKKVLNIQVFPQFLEDMFGEKLDTLRTRIEILEDQIRLDCAILSINTDQDCTVFITTGSSAAFGGSDSAISGSGDSFAFLSDESTGQVSDIHDLVVHSNPDERDSRQVQDLVIEDKKNNTSFNISNKDIFSGSQKYSALKQAIVQQNLTAQGIPIISADKVQKTNQRLDDLIKRIFLKSGQRVDKKDYIITNTVTGAVVQPPENASIDSFKVIQELSDKIRDRQKALKLFYSTLKNAQEFQALDDDPDLANRLITPGVYGNSHIPEVFEHMIEDETYDDYGLNSGKRFIIKRAQIKQITIAEQAPPYTAVAVQGLLSPAFRRGDDVPQGLNLPNFGNGLTAAMAVDYDMWRAYGYKEGSPVAVPFLSDPVSQCAPFATMLLSRARKEVLTGSVTISGNEFMQPGEVVFLEDRQMLFYVRSVRHTFTNGRNFETTLDLSYGHVPGEYIPTTVDVIGKMIYNNRDVADLAVQRQDSSFSEQAVGVVQRASDISQGSANPTIVNQATPNGFSTNFSAQNAQVINNILFNSKYLINANSAGGKKVTASIELRLYHDSSNSTDDDLKKFATGIMELLTGQNDTGLNAFTVTKQGTAPETLPPDSVTIEEVDMDDANDSRSPSQKAVDAARNWKGAKSLSGGGASNPGNNSDGGTPTVDTSGVKSENLAIRTALFKYIVDCWIVITPDDPVQSENGS